jgi:hypothetical protein
MSFLSALAVSTLLIAPDEVPAERAAAIERDQAKATQAVQQKFGNRKSSELSPDERREMVRDQAEAEQKVLDKFGVDRKSWALSQARRTREEREQVKQASKALDEQEQNAAKKAAEDAAIGPKEIVVQKGISEDRPVVLEEKEGAEPIVEKGLPADYQSEQAEAEQGDVAEKKGTEAPATGRTKKQ